jgi:hypothetical protein
MKKNYALELRVLAVLVFILSIFCNSQIFAVNNKVVLTTGISVATQVGIPVAGTPSSATYLVTLTCTGGATTANSTQSITWSPTTPVGVSPTISAVALPTTVSLTGSQVTITYTLTLTTNAITAAGSYSFTLTTTNNAATSATVAFNVSGPTNTLTLANPTTTVGAANVNASTSKIPIHAFKISANGSSGSGSLTNFQFTTTGTYSASEITNFKIWENTTNNRGTANLRQTNSSPTAAGIQTFSAFTSTVGFGATMYYWITMDVAGSITNGHTLAVSASASTDMTTTLIKAGSAVSSGLQTFTVITAATIPYTENFDGVWTSPSTIPTYAWSCVETGNLQWHRNDYTTGWSSSSGAYAPTGANGTSYSARFHSYDASSGTGSLISPLIDFSPSGLKMMDFYYINTDGTDQLDVYLSTDGGSTWSGTPVTTIVTSTVWTKYSVILGSSTSATVKIKFVATTDYGNTDIGLDGVNIYICTATPPSTQATSFSSSAITSNSMTISWTRGNGSDVLVVAKQLSAPSDPSNGTIYTANATYGSGTSCGGGYVVYSGSGTSVNVTGLSSVTQYYFAIYEFTGCSSTYNLTELTGNATTIAPAPSTSLNYIFSASSGSFTANASPTQIWGTSADESYNTLITLPFTFYYGGCATSAYTTCYVSTNGWINLGATATGSKNTNDLSWINYGPIIAPLWDDLSTYSSGSSVNYKTTGVAPNRVFTVEWLNMRWDYASTATISFQVKLYETSNTIEFVYRQEAGAVSNTSGGASIGLCGGSVSTDFYSLNNTGTSPTAIYGTQTSNLSTRPATGQIYTWTLPTTMTYVSSTVTQASTADTYQATNNQEITKVQIAVNGSCSPFNLLQMVINMNGSSSISDITNIDVYYTGTSASYTSSNLFGSVAPASGSLTVNGSKTLQPGTNYFWIVYDVSPTAVIGDYLDAECTQLTLSGGIGNKVPSGNPPSGSRPIVMQPSTFAQWIEQGWARCVIQSTDGKLVWAGNTTNTYSSGGSDTYIVKTSTDLSTIVWTRVAGIMASDESLYDIVETSDGYVAVGNSNMAGGAGGIDILVVKVNTSGVIQWAETFGTTGTDYGYGICKTFDGNVAICGSLNAGDYGCVAKLDNSNGNILFQKCVSAGGSGGNYLRDIIETSDHGLLLGGDKSNDFYILKLKSDYTVDGGMKWGGGSTDNINFVLENAANDYTVGGGTYSSGFGAGDGYVMRFVYNPSAKAAPTVTWENTYGTSTANHFDNGVKTADGGYALSGITTRFGVPTDDEAFIARINSSGDNIFMKSIGTLPAGEDQEGYGIAALADGTYVMSGLNNVTSATHFYMMKISGSGYSCATIQDNGDVKSLSATPPTITTGVGSLNTFYTLTSVSRTLTISSGTGGVIASNGCNTSLPVELLYFTGYNDGNANVLKWSTVSEINNDFFTVEHSKDVEIWLAIGTVDGAGNSNSNMNYNFTDNEPYDGSTYYRLRQTDFNGKAEYSEIIALSRNGDTNSTIKVFPNPFSQTFCVQLNNNSTMDNTAEIRNCIGQKMKDEIISKGNIITEINLGDLPDGVYYIKIYNEQSSCIKKIVKESK